MAKLVLNTTTDLLKVVDGTEIKLLDGREGVVKENMADGQWLSCLMQGEEDAELVHSQDIAELHSPE
jgi:hypothetical protein